MFMAPALILLAQLQLINCSVNYSTCRNGVTHRERRIADLKAHKAASVKLCELESQLISVHNAVAG